MNTKTVLILGAGKIGQAIALMLSHEIGLNVLLVDSGKISLPFEKTKNNITKFSNLPVEKLLKNPKQFANIDAIVSCLPFAHTLTAARLAKLYKCHFFDLTEDRHATSRVEEIAKDASKTFVSQCGLAPGFIGMIGIDLVRQFEKVENLQLRVGALPIYPSNRLKYNLTWSTEGLVNQHLQPCDAIENGRHIYVKPLEGYQHFFVDFEEYEAFNTSGGCGTLHLDLAGVVQTMNYKSIRYKGHREQMLFLLEDLKLAKNPEILVKLFNDALPITNQDKVIIWAEATGLLRKKMMKINHSATIYHTTIANVPVSAIQLTTAAGVCGAIELILSGRHGPIQGWLPFHRLPLDLFMQGPFGKYFNEWGSARK